MRAKNEGKWMRAYLDCLVEGRGVRLLPLSFWSKRGQRYWLFD